MNELLTQIGLTPLEIVTLQSLVVSKKQDVMENMGKLNPNGETYSLLQKQLQTLDLLSFKLMKKN